MKTAAKAFAFFVCVLFAFVTLSCGGGGGGGGASLGGSSSFGTKTLSIDINGLMGGARASARPDKLNWTQIDLTVYINDEVVYNESIPKGNNDVIRIENVKIGSEVRAEAKIHVEVPTGMPADVREAKSETITVQTGTNKVTLYVPYKVKFNLGNDGIATFEENGDNVLDSTYYTRSFGIPKYTRAPEYPNHTVAYWCTDPDLTTRFDPTQGGDVNELYAKWQEGDIVYTQDYYNTHSVYQIDTAEQFMQIFELSKLSNNTFADKTLNINSDLVLDSSFTGLGGNNYFNGIIEGNDHTITVAIASGAYYVGLINQANNATVRDLTVAGTLTVTSIGPTNNSKPTYVGGIVGARGSSTIVNCHSTATISVQGNAIFMVGGITGISSTAITGCTNSGNINGSGANQSRIGGIIGFQRGGTSSEVANCTNSGNITGGNSTSVGGIVGDLGVLSDTPSILTGCSNTGTVSTGNNGTAGGIAGKNCVFTISESHNTADVTATGADSVVGGIAGENGGTDNGSNAKIEKSYNTGIVRGASSGTGSAGGVVGKMSNGTVDQCFNKGIVRSEAGGAETVAPGGVVGTLAGGTVKNVYSTALYIAGPIPYAGGIVGERTNGYLIQAFTTTTDFPSSAFIFGKGGADSNYCYCDGGTTNDSRAKGDLAMANQTDNNGLPGAYPDVWQAGIDYPTLINCPEPL